MNDNITCAQVQEYLMEFCDGSLEENLPLQITAHLSECAECAVEVRREQRLLSLMAAIPVEMPPVVTWSEVSRKHHVRERGAFRGWKPALAFAATAVSLASLFLFNRNMTLSDTQPVSVTIPGDAEETTGNAFTQAHMLSSVGDAFGDPTRFVILAHVQEGGGQSP